MDNDENIYRINLRNALTASNLIYDLSAYLEKDEAKYNKIGEDLDKKFNYIKDEEPKEE